MRKKTISLIVVLVALMFAAVGVASGVERVNVEVEVIYASNQPHPTEPSLSRLKIQLQSFNFTSYTLLEKKRMVLSRGNEGKLSIPGKKYLKIELEEVIKGQVKLKVVVLDRRRVLLTTMFRISPGQTVLVGGPRYESGTLIIAIKADF